MNASVSTVITKNTNSDVLIDVSSVRLARCAAWDYVVFVCLKVPSLGKLKFQTRVSSLAPVDERGKDREAPIEKII